jgi:Cu+-exporting ATPase
MDIKTRDPVCGSTVDTTFSSRRHSYGGWEYYFCSDVCMSRFMEDPLQYTWGPGDKI